MQEKICWNSSINVRFGFPLEFKRAVRVLGRVFAGYSAMPWLITHACTQHARNTHTHYILLYIARDAGIVHVAIKLSSRDGYLHACSCHAETINTERDN